MEAVVFDLDQTLVDTLRRFHSLINVALALRGFRPIPWRAFRRMYSKDVLEGALPRGVSAEVWEDFRRWYCSFSHPMDGPIPGARRALESAREAGLARVVTTGRGCPCSEVWAELERYGLADLVDEVYTASERPDGEWHAWSREWMLRRVAEDLGVEPEEMLFVCDYWVDVESARRVGVPAVAVLTGLEPEERLRRFGALEVIEGIWEFPLVLERILRGGGRGP
ncbi:MAG: hypothetical protein DRO06_00785 [Thermoproteota archaeon]|nr:MAG: hypothetical protein DRO06_00785 [Candidatus Korarchaeota archaeon]